MSVTVRVIPCLDVDNGRVVKGVNFEGLRDAGDPVELAQRYDREGADELTFLDVSASKDGRGTILDVVRRTADQVFIPLTVGGGVRSEEDVDTLLRAGADKVSLNSSAIARPELLRELSQRFGAQCIVLSIDARRAEGYPSGFEVTTHGGTKSAGVDAIEWAKQGEALGVGEILLNSMDGDGTKQGFDIELIEAVRAVVTIPVIASGGAGAAKDFPPAVAAGADAVLAASIFHFGEVEIKEVKQAMAEAGSEVRL
ncbi:imidazole glycerol phosphate synthase subunit HisF [Corynebacterium sp. 320]|uniref:imidazole glycerol phosphate synthase subunit HisF n=1 Tax=Corynebacterium TaxID=1716 RepID=UPI00125CB97C|nr:MULTISPECIES: imidazole glycerol phosphate synthase subunit HisF [Corynebacterium]KAB1502537.1 imidazole glycerol phosphate synthase subunit HisF [Corynebacterium sp. 320]KAB1551242.1 imidazole glycerol phosphate synthase subunit HisF [Corynebacterium sp. 321]KAB1551930.1 imidazole glycerol phosphate synthase subunit HisF [Corynebacterium sp. 319]KAB3526144.1 imidazole glycerol phosphate synthase subunit HisF [Corynebacterium sp. 250]KAB3538924.1 imidazole glycerol phosphate synthase subuni